MSLGSWLDRMQAQRTGFDDKYVSARAARIAQALAADEEERVARRAERAEAARLRQQQADELKRLRERQKFDDAFKFARGQVALVDGKPQLPTDFDLPAEFLDGSDDPDNFRAMVGQGAVAEYMAKMSAAEEARRLKAAEEAERQRREIEAEGRALENAKRLAQFRAGLDDSDANDPLGDRIPRMTEAQALMRAQIALATRVPIKDGPYVTYVTKQGDPKAIRALADEFLGWAEEARNRRLGRMPDEPARPAAFPYALDSVPPRPQTFSVGRFVVEADE